MVRYIKGDDIVKVSVIVPVFNGEKTIERCLKSALNQTLRDIEIIVVNDGSSDKTLDIINRLDDNRIKLLTQKNQGQGLARNAGMAVSSGEYIGFLDADDTIVSSMYEKMYAAAVEHDADMVQCNLTDIYPDGRSITQLSEFEGEVKILDKAEYMTEYMTGYIHSYEVCNKLFKRDFLERNKLSFADTKKYFSEDILFNMEAVKYLSRVFFIKEPYYNYYQNPDSHMKKGACDRLSKMLDLFDDYLRSADGRLKEAASGLAAMATMYNIGNCGSYPIPENAVKRVKEYIKNMEKSKLTLKKKLFLTVVRYSPKDLIIAMAKFFFCS